MNLQDCTVYKYLLIKPILLNFSIYSIESLRILFIYQHNNVKNIQFLRGLHSLSIINTNGYMHSVLLDKKT